PRPLTADLPVQRDQEPDEQRTEEPVRADLQIEIHQRMKRDGKQRHGDAHTQDVERMDAAPERRPPIASNEHEKSEENEAPAHDPRLPQNLKVVIVRLIPALRRARGNERREALLEGAQPRPDPKKAR